MVLILYPFVRQGRNAEGIRHLERVANLKEPKDSKSKAHYYDAFVLLARYKIWSKHTCLSSDRMFFYLSYFCYMTLNAMTCLFSALYNEGRKVEAAKYLRLAAAYDSSYSVYLEDCEKDEDAFVNDLISSRRGDY